MERNEIYILNPHYHLRNDTRRIVMFSKNRTDANSSSNWYSFIHPLQALMLSFFTFERSLEENIKLLNNYFHCQHNEMEHYIMPFIENKELLSTRWHGQEIVFPRNVLIRASEESIYLNHQPKNFVCDNLDLSERRLYEAPLSITLMLTNKCVTDCCYCYADRKSRSGAQLSTERICELIEEAGKLKMKCVNMIGGEVFLHPDWAQILKKTIDCHVEAEYVSTKMPLTKDIIEKLQQIGYKGIIQISLDTLDTKVIESTLKVSEEYLEAVKRGLILLDESGLKYQIATVLTTYNANIDILMELYNFLTGLKNIVTWSIVPVHDSLYPKVENFQSLKPDSEILRTLSAYFDEISKLSDFNIIYDKKVVYKKYYLEKGGAKNFKGNKCPALNTNLFILPDGKVTICEQLYWHPFFIIGDVSRDKISSVWKSGRAIYLAKNIWNDIRPVSTCSRCGLRKECFESNNRCWADILKAYGRENYDFPDPRCEYADEMKNYIGY